MHPPSEHALPTAPICVSIVSHGHGQQTASLIEQLLLEPLVGQLLVTFNVPETLNLPEHERLLVISNTRPKGFGANHNTAFEHCHLPYFCVLNPDVVINDRSLPELVSCIEQDRAGVVGPLVTNTHGQQEDSWRHFPTVTSLLLKCLGHDRSVIGMPRATSAVKHAQDKPADDVASLTVDWVAGMCMLFQSDGYAAVNGFDERFFLYYEDVDICARLWDAGHAVVACPQATIIHHAQRASHRHWRYTRWHLASMCRYLIRQGLSRPRANR